MTQQELVGGFRYSDAYMDDDRLVIETLRSAESTGRLVTLNYAKAEAVTGGASEEDYRVEVVDQWDYDSSQSYPSVDHPNRARLQIKARQVASTVGPWTDQLRKCLNPSAAPCLRPTKGVHITLDRARLPLRSAVVMGAESRIVFAIPRHEMVIVGTTDTDFKQDPSRVVAEDEDIRYLLSVLNDYFPGAEITAQDIIASYAGVRPLVQDGAASEGKTSREHTIWTESNGVHYVAGGKYTTYRLIAEQAMNHVLKHYSYAEQSRWSHSQSKRALNAKVNYDFHPERAELVEHLLVQGLPLSRQECEKLVDRFGPEALLFKDYFGSRTYIQFEALYAIRFGFCISLRDFYFRRVPLVLAHADYGWIYLSELHELWKQELGLEEHQWLGQVKELQYLIEQEMAWKNNFR